MLCLVTQIDNAKIMKFIGFAKRKTDIRLVLYLTVSVM